MGERDADWPGEGDGDGEVLVIFVHKRLEISVTGEAGASYVCRVRVAHTSYGTERHTRACIPLTMYSQVGAFGEGNPDD